MARKRKKLKQEAALGAQTELLGEAPVTHGKAGGSTRGKPTAAPTPEAHEVEAEEPSSAGPPSAEGGAVEAGAPDEAEVVTASEEGPVTDEGDMEEAPAEEVADAAQPAIPAQDPGPTAEPDLAEPAGPEAKVPEPDPSPVRFELVAEEGREVHVPPAGERLTRAKELVQGGRIAEAISLYREVLIENPANLKARNNLGVLYDETGQVDLALDQFEAAIQLEPENVEVLTNYGATLTSVAKYDAAEELLRRALRLSPESVSVRSTLGILHFRRGIYAQAELDLRWVCEQDDTHGPAFYYRGEALNRLSRYDEARAVLERAIALQPLNAKAYYSLGHLYDRAHLTEEAALMYEKSKELQRR